MYFLNSLNRDDSIIGGMYGVIYMVRVIIIYGRFAPTNL